MTHGNTKKKTFFTDQLMKMTSLRFGKTALLQHGCGGLCMQKAISILNLQFFFFFRDTGTATSEEQIKWKMYIQFNVTNIINRAS